MGKITEFQKNGLSVGRPLPKKKEKIKNDEPLLIPTLDFYKEAFDSIGLFDDEEAANIFDEIDGTAEEMLRNLNAPVSSFILHPDSVEDILNFIDDVENNKDMSQWALNIQYFAFSSEMTAYTLSLHNSPGDEEDQINTVACLLRQEPGGPLESYIPEQDAWKQDPDLQKVMEARNSDSSAGDIVTGLEYLSGIPASMMDTKTTLDFLDKNRILVDLCDRLDGLGCIRILSEYSSKSGKYHTDRLRAVLLPDDTYRHGTVVYCENDQFYVCQMLFNENDTDETFFFNTDTTAESCTNFRRIIWKTNDTESVAELLSKMWDKYNRGTDWYTMPLSGRSYINVPVNDDAEINPIYTNGARKISKTEEENLKWVRDKLSISEKNGWMC